MEAAQAIAAHRFELINGPINKAIIQADINEAAWSNLAKIIFRRTYLRNDKNDCETFREALPITYKHGNGLIVVHPPLKYPWS
jgi:hypothetical protein